MKTGGDHIEKATAAYRFSYRFLFSELSEQDLETLQQNAHPKPRKRGEELFRQGEFPKGVYWVISGKVKIFQQTPDGQRQTLYVYSDGDLIAYRQLIAHENNPVSAALLEDSVIGFIHAHTFLGLLNDSPAFARSMLSAIARDFTVWTSRFTVFAKYPLRRRLMLALLILYEQYRTSGPGTGEILMTRTDLAEYVGASLETVVRALNVLKREGLVAVKGRVIVLPDPGQLLRLIQDEGER